MELARPTCKIRRGKKWHAERNVTTLSENVETVFPLFNVVEIESLSSLLRNLVFRGNYTKPVILGSL